MKREIKSESGAVGETTTAQGTCTAIIESSYSLTVVGFQLPHIFALLHVNIILYFASYRTTKLYDMLK